MTNYTEIESPIDPLLLVTDGRAITGIWMQPAAPRAGWVRDDAHPVLQEAAAQLAAYFAGERNSFDLPLAPAGTQFQLRVWSELSRIPYGQTISYGEIARRIGHPTASRAVGLANGSNPLPIVVPCHRVIGANGKLTGFGGGLRRKQALLDLEARVANGRLF